MFQFLPKMIQLTLQARCILKYARVLGLLLYKDINHPLLFDRF